MPDRAVAVAKLMNEAVKVAEKIAALSLPIVMMTRESVNRAFETTLAEGVHFELPADGVAPYNARPECCCSSAGRATDS